MGLKQSIMRSENRVGGLFDNGYFRILESNVDRRNNKWRIRVGGFVDQDARLLPSNTPGMMGDDHRIIIDKWFETSIQDDISIAAAYDFLKTQTYFLSANDIFEEGQV